MPMSDLRAVTGSAVRLAEILREADKRVAFAESCTGGLVAASLAQIPGISDHLCGSSVVYRTATKTAWLGVDPALLDDPAIGPVSAEVTRALALAVLERTPEADLSAAVTGHLGPNAPPELDGVVYVAVTERAAPERVVAELRHVLGAIGDDPAEVRCQRQRTATKIVLDAVADVLASSGRGPNSEPAG